MQLNQQVRLKKRWKKLHKKLINGFTYYYSAYRDKNGEHRTVYLGSNYELAKKRERDVLGRNSWLSLKNNSTKNSLVLVALILGIGLVFLSGQMTGLAVYSPDTVEFDMNSSWNLSDALVRVSLNEQSIDLLALGLLENDRLVLHLEQLGFNTTGRLYADLIVGNELVDSRYVDVLGAVINAAVNETASNIGVLEEGARSRLKSDGVEINTIKKEGSNYEVTVGLESEKKGSVVLQVNNVSDIKKVQIVRLKENVIQL